MTDMFSCRCGYIYFYGTLGRQWMAFEVCYS